MSSRLQWFEVKLIMGQEIQSIRAENGPGPRGPWNSQRGTSML